MLTAEIRKDGMINLLKKLDARKRDAVIRKSLYQGAIYITGWIKSKRLTGPRPRFLGVVTGRLRSSITAEQTTKSNNNYSSKIGTNVVYAHRHEAGTYGMPARPFMKPALDNRLNISTVRKILKMNITKQLEA